MIILSPTFSPSVAMVTMSSPGDGESVREDALAVLAVEWREGSGDLGTGTGKEREGSSNDRKPAYSDHHQCHFYRQFFLGQKLHALRDLFGGTLPPATISLTNLSTYGLYCLACILMVEGTPPELAVLQRRHQYLHTASTSRWLTQRSLYPITNLLVLVQGTVGVR